MDWDFELGLNYCFELSDCDVWVLHSDSLQTISTANSEHHIGAGRSCNVNLYEEEEIDRYLETDLRDKQLLPVDVGIQKMLPEI